MASKKKSVLITGCSSGIGKQLALAFHERGFRVFATARKPEALEELTAKGLDAINLVVDDEDSVKQAFAEVEKRLDGRGLDYLINNAGRSYVTPAIHADPSETLQTFSANFFSVVRINMTFLPLLRKARGTIVHIGSIAAVFPYVFGSMYNASKGALHSYTMTLRIELAPLGVHVVEVITGGVLSSIARTKRELPSESPYGPGELAVQDIYKRRQGHSQEVGMPTKVYAEEVTSKVINSRGRFWNTDEIWAGAKAGQIWIACLIDHFTGGKLSRWAVGKIFGFPLVPPSNSWLNS